MEEAAMTPSMEAVVLMLSAASGVGAAAARGQLRTESDRAVSGTARSAAPKVDWLGTATGWDSLPGGSLSDIDWRNEHAILSICAILLFCAQAVRLLALREAPSEYEVWVTTAIYLPWIFLCLRDTAQLESHYRVTFYASCGWGFMSLASLYSVLYQDKFPAFSFGILSVGIVVFAVACIYFYSYHWTRMWRHFCQNRLRPLWIPGLAGLMSLHALSFGDYWKRVDDSKWWSTVCTVYPDQWWWVADVRIIELFVTAAALWLILLHLKGVFTGMKNAFVVVFATIFVPFLIMVAETSWIRASAWQHYLMVGPKYW